ncbi:hypothetical protein KRR38_23040 [Novosphingobium sp. G106]|uniref:hypothetical protein n=1 Tax=Novosphingobium sp. G106 TaxID=2849500 RepID=UPI001C2D1334|nr:hypothetical protein [Novosphingobium sp. G106]MBV1690478.1 hypothetical protein [Novosphingobium sp. G106]
MMKEPSQITETSPLSRTVRRDDRSVEVQIYRDMAEPRWTLKIVNQAGTAIMWTEDFLTDQDALRAFEADLERDGIESYDDDAPTTCPLCRAIGL